MTRRKPLSVRSPVSRTACCLLTIVAATVACQSRARAQAQSVNEIDDVKGPKLRFIESNGIRMRIAEMGEGPLVLLLHGWPESWYSWRHQLPALASAGFRAVAPDLRGYGKSDTPEAVEEYDIVNLTGDAVGILDALRVETAVVVGHDWGAIVAWNCVLLHPKRFRALIAMSVPYGGRPKESLVTTLKRWFGDNFFYILYFQEPGVAEAEFDKDPRAILSRLYLSPDAPRERPEVTDPKRSAGGWIPRLGAPKKLPDWVTAEDLDYYVQQFTEAGFRGGINFYRNLHRNWEITPQLAGAQVEQPVLFVAGEKDVVIRGATESQLTAQISRATKDLRGVKLIPDTGHWVQQESPKETNTAVVEFLKALD
jgi:pimeloyl-ACP methyl ester carboxylesterase